VVQTVLPGIHALILTGDGCDSGYGVDTIDGQQLLHKQAWRRPQVAGKSHTISDVLLPTPSLWQAKGEEILRKIHRVKQVLTA